jgi:hypothetical protein
MHTTFDVYAKRAVFALGFAALVTLAGCDTNYYGDSGREHTTTTVTTTPAAPPPPAATSSTTVTPNPDGSVTTTERTYRRY